MLSLTGFRWLPTFDFVSSKERKGNYFWVWNELFFPLLLFWAKENVAEIIKYIRWNFLECRLQAEEIEYEELDGF